MLNFFKEQNNVNDDTPSFWGGQQNIITPYKTFFNVELKNNDCSA